ncbi:MAG: hypothetical protein WC867_08725 [Candidatus Pacearchaeota archaeon]|jgi:DNA primase large subunit
METRHIKITYGDVLDAKKQILVSELGILHVLKHIRNYRVLRKKEDEVKAKIKNEMDALKQMIIDIYTYLPRDGLKKELDRLEENNSDNKLKKLTLQDELEEISLKLKQLENLSIKAEEEIIT